jgi:hypothetical protein
MAVRGAFPVGHLVLLLIVRISHAGTISFGVLLIALSLCDVAGKTAQFAFTGVVLLLSILGFAWVWFGLRRRASRFLFGLELCLFFIAALCAFLILRELI